MNILVIWILCQTLTGIVTPYRILGLFPHPGASHYKMFEPLMKELANRGHEVDVVNHFPQEKPVLRFNDLSIKGTMNILQNNVSTTFLSTKFRSRLAILKYIIEEIGLDYCEKLFEAPIVQKLKNTKNKYDLVITEIFGNECVLGFGYHFKVPVIGMISSVSTPWGSARFGNPDNPSYIPNYFASYTGQMNLMQRLDNTAFLLLAKLWFSLAQHKATAISRKFFGNDLPDLHELALNTSLVLVNSHYSITSARPNVPNFIEVGGLHISPGKPVRSSLENALNITAAHKGVIYFSMGSMVLTETFPKELLIALFDAFRELPYKVLWKATKEKMPHDIDIPSNIYFESWIPQSDVLCHPNVKLFITHGGLLGTQEATYCGVPCLGIPLFADQELNLKALVEHGLALTLTYSSITKEDFLTTAKELLYNPSYKENADIASRRFRDRPLSPLDTAVFWVEYVIRHNGARHLRSTGADLPWYQYHLLDVCAVLLLGTLIIFYVIYRVIKILLAKLCISYIKLKQKVN